MGPGRPKKIMERVKLKEIDIRLLDTSNIRLQSINKCINIIHNLFYKKMFPRKRGKINLNFKGNNLLSVFLSDKSKKEMFLNILLKERVISSWVPIEIILGKIKIKGCIDGISEQDGKFKVYFFTFGTNKSIIKNIIVPILAYTFLCDFKKSNFLVKIINGINFKTLYLRLYDGAEAIEADYYKSYNFIQKRIYNE